MSQRKPILISGAGLASLLTAQALRKYSIPFLIYESDASLTFRAQGYRLRMSSEGLDAIESVLSKEHFQRFWDRCGKTAGGAQGQAGYVTGLDARTGEVLQSSEEDAGNAVGKGTAGGEGEEGKKNAIPKEPLSSRDGKIVGISRGDMRRTFLEGCEDNIIWSHRVVDYELTSSGVRAIFADGSKGIEGEMLIGGDGIYSKIAKKLSDGKLKVYDTGARGIHGQAPTTAFKGLGEGVWRMSDDSDPKGRVFVMTNVRPGDMDDPTVQFGWTMGAQPGVIEAPGGDYHLIGKPAADIAQKLTKDWHPRLRPLFENMDVAEAAFWKITCSTPTGVPEWKNDPRVTVIGDAAHSMTPAGGIGANTAVQDSALLGRLIGEAGGFKEGVTEAYEREMRVYGSRAVASSYGMANKVFGIKIDENSPTV